MYDETAREKSLTPAGKAHFALSDLLIAIGGTEVSGDIYSEEEFHHTHSAYWPALSLLKQ